MRVRILACAIWLHCGLVLGAVAQPQLQVPDPVLKGLPFAVTVEGLAPDSGYVLRVEGRTYALTPENGVLRADSVRVARSGRVPIVLERGGQVVARAEARALPGWTSVLPPLLAILIALLFRRVVPALFLGIWLGAWLAADVSLSGLWQGLLDSFDVYVRNALADPDHAAIVLFSLMIGGMVGIISKNGGMQGVVNRIIRWAGDPRRGQLAATVLGLLIFFDDYANTLVVGNTMRPVTDRLRISREKLAYIVDSTAAPVACLAFVTTWIGYEVGLVGTAVAQIPGYDESAYSIFLNSIPYSFYPWLALLFVFAVAWTQRDFGPMYRAELRARTTGQVLGPDARIDEAAAEGREFRPPDDKPHRARNALIPILVLFVSVLGGLYATGEGETLRDIIGSADSYRALMWGSLLGVLSAAALSIGQRILTLDETMEAWYAGLRSMFFAMIILLLAWALSSITEELRTAQYLSSVLSERLAPGLVPALVFVLAAATAFATGTSWGTMGILLPLVVPLAWHVLAASGLHTETEYHHIIYSTVSAVLAGAVWGDHCSPISDTTILSSMASGCDHIEHVRTQLPYALFVGIVAVLLGTLPTGFGWPWWLSMGLSAAVLLLGLRLLGKKVPGAAEPVAE
ncbi:Na+/H+ antiporter NhaC family protein [Rhodothermus marinus]|uniref:Na+/H+ antiporter NhaC n=1 Tax=Rhodothermus marinus (strain ATCC 43812 / DSM 4252 / R-10) TaxID=518766 RepID=D0MJ75_RHOM4|nr:Na+/H+ antiporter NhaC family protein [Rhodothermus marinus]ACY48533.1 Na+/H+ antiporter NhaC [Rhodothermus marinus DSM 4252]